MNAWMSLCLALAPLVPEPQRDVDESEPVAFVPFTVPSYQLINSVSFSPDDQLLYCALLLRAVRKHRGLPVGEAPETGIFSATRTADGWSEPELLPFSGTYGDYEPSLSPDGKLLVFNSKRPYSDGRVPESNDLWSVVRTQDGWGEPERIEALTSFDHEESYGTLTADRTLIYLRGLPDADGELLYDLYQSRFVDGAFSAPTRHPVSTDRWGEGDACVAADGSYMIFTRWDNDVGWGTTVDLYIAFAQEAGWSEPTPLEDLNTPGPDYSPAISADGKWLYYRANSRFKRVPLDPILSWHRPI